MHLIVPTTKELKTYDDDKLKSLASDIRSFLVEKTNEKGGHLASNLGVVELTLALHRVFDFSKDRLIWDVGHQSYTHKILSGRADQFSTLHDFNGLSGFPKASESSFDAFDTGHSSTSLSAALGYAYARDLKHEDYKVVAVIGDGSMTGGESFEALNNASLLRKNLIFILNDNEMSISENVGGIKSYFSAIRTGTLYNSLKARMKRTLIRTKAGNKIIKSISNTKDSLKEILLPEGMVFENLGIKYFGPYDGHDIKTLERVLSRATKLNRCVLIHVLTQKGKGFTPAEKHPEQYHGVNSHFLTENSHPHNTFSEIFGEKLTKEAESHPEIVAITAAMEPNVGLTPFKKSFPSRFFDVGIAEPHAMTFAAGLAKGGMHPYLPLFSSFFQRALDQMVEDVSLQNLPVTVLLDRAGLVSGDGETHQGIFDIAFLLPVPNVTILAPRSGNELSMALDFSLNYSAPLVIRYPKGEAEIEETSPRIEYGKAETPEYGEKVAILSFGTEYTEAKKVRALLQNRGICPTLVNMRFVKPLDVALLRKLSETHSLFVTMEDGILTGGVGEKIKDFVFTERLPVSVLSFGVPDLFVPTGDLSSLRTFCHMDAPFITEKILEKMS